MKKLIYVEIKDIISSKSAAIESGKCEVHLHLITITIW